MKTATMRKTMAVLAALVLAGLCATAALAQPQADVDMTVQPADIIIGALFDGTSLTVTGAVPAGSEALVRFVGAPTNLHVKKKGRVLGLWMNLDAVALEDVPSVFIVNASKPLDELEGSMALRSMGLEEQVKMEPAQADADGVFQEMLKLKRKEGLYREGSGSVTLSPPDAGVQPFTAEIKIPARLSPGIYQVQVFAVRDGAVVGQAEQDVTADLTGIPEFLSDMAFDHGALYGILATLVALMAGLAIGLVFQSKGAH